MEPVLKQKWITALRSGEYKQCTYKLYQPETNSYCCLGVLLEVAGHNKDDFKDKGRLLYYLGEDNELLDRNTEHALATMNDGGTSFETIANVIETATSY